MNKVQVNILVDQPPLNKDLILKTIHELSPELRTVYNVKRMGLFGSYASGSAHEHSDIDIIAEFESGADIWDLSGLKIKLESIFGVSVDVTTVSALKPEMRDSILANIAYS